MDELLENAKRASNFLKALANENRLIILCCLAESEKNVGELENMLGKSPAVIVATISSPQGRWSGRNSSRLETNLL